MIEVLEEIIKNKKVSKVVFLLLAGFSVVGRAGEREYFPMGFETNRLMFSIPFPAGLHPHGLPPEKVELEHLTPMLDVFERCLRRGAVDHLRRQKDAYLLEFLDDNRFADTLHARYAAPLFEEFAKREPAVVYLYYRTGGDLDALQKLYKKTKDDEVKDAIEACLDDSAEFVEVHAPVEESNTEESDLLVRLSCSPSWDGYEVQVELTNQARLPVLLRLPMINYRGHAQLRWNNSRITQKDHPDEWFRCRDQWPRAFFQEVVLYPGDCLVKRNRFIFHLNNTKHWYTARCTVFSVFMNPWLLRLNEFAVSRHPEAPLEVELQYLCDYQFLTRRGEVEEGDPIKESASNIISLRYTPSDEMAEYTREQADVDRRRARWEELIEQIDVMLKELKREAEGVTEGVTH